MKKNRLIAGVAVLLSMILFCGCGDTVYELTDEERAVIVSYSSHVLSKFNKKQPEGVTDVGALEAKMQAELEAQEEALKQEQEKEQEQQTPEQPDAQTPSSDSQENSETPESQTPENVNYVSLNQALQLGGIDAVYKKYEFTDTYKESESYVTARSGNELLVLQVNLVNNGSKPAECDILEKMPSFRLKLNGSTSVSADTTILLNDLGTYQSTIEPDVPERTVLIFQIQKGLIKEITSMDLDVVIEDTTATVRLVGD